VNPYLPARTKQVNDLTTTNTEEISIQVTCIGYCREYDFKMPGSKFSLERS
jgi:hypothetical protein